MLIERDGQSLGRIELKDGYRLVQKVDRTAKGAYALAASGKPFLSAGEYEFSVGTVLVRMREGGSRKHPTRNYDLYVIDARGALCCVRDDEGKEVASPSQVGPSFLDEVERALSFDTVALQRQAEMREAAAARKAAAEREELERRQAEEAKNRASLAATAVQLAAACYPWPAPEEWARHTILDGAREVAILRAGVRDTEALRALRSACGAAARGVTDYSDRRWGVVPVTAAEVRAVRDALVAVAREYDPSAPIPELPEIPAGYLAPEVAPEVARRRDLLAERATLVARLAAIDVELAETQS